MEVLKEKYLTLSIHRQIQAGVTGVSVCMCSLVFLLLLINSFILINMSYYDTVSFFEQRDNEQIQLVSFHVDGILDTMSEKNKLNIQVLRNFIQNFKKNPEFILPFSKLKVDRYLTKFTSDQIPECENGKQNCIFYKFLDKDYTEDENFNFHLRILSVTIPFLKNMFNLRFNGLNNVPIYQNIQIFSNVFKTLFFYSQSTELNKKFNKEDMMNLSQYHINSTYETFESVVKEINNIKSEMTNSTIAVNPFITSLTILDRYNMSYVDAFKYTPSIVSVSSSLYNQNSLTATKENLENMNNLLDLIVSDLSTNVIDTYTFVITAKYKGINHLITNRQDKIVSPSSCQYLIKLHQTFTSDYSYNEGKFKLNAIYPNDCLYYPANNTFNKYFKDKSFLNGMKRRSRFPLIVKFENRDIKFKILLLNSPDIITRIQSSSSLLSNMKTWVYIFKNQEYHRRKIDRIYYLFLGGMLFILLINLGIWFFIIILISIILYRVSNSISKPINELVLQVTSIGQEGKIEKLNENKNSLDDIHFPDDKNIDELFQMCKVLIKGGFTDDNNSLNTIRFKKMKLVNYAYNNISIIKTNNLIIQEEKIENDFSSREFRVFNYKKETLNNLIDLNNEDSFNRNLGKNVVSDVNENVMMETRIHTRFDDDYVQTINEPQNDFFFNNFSKKGYRDEDILDIIFKEEQMLKKDKTYLHRILMENTNEGSEIELITL